jgi:hypothetical protein
LINHTSLSISYNINKIIINNKKQQINKQTQINRTINKQTTNNKPNNHSYESKSTTPLTTPVGKKN